MSRTGSFKTTADLLRARIRAAGEARGFAATRLLTHWEEIVGEDLARLARPKDIRYGRGRSRKGADGADPQGATLVLEVAGPAALRLEMERERIRERVNAVYGYAAIAAIRIVQMGPLGFSKPSDAFAAPPPAAPDPDLASRAAPLAAEVGDTELRLALAALAANVLAKSRA
jgi:hypothetical protein